MGRFAIVKDLGVFSTPGVDVGSQFLRLVDQPNPSQTLQLLTSGPVAVILSSKLLPLLGCFDLQAYMAFLGQVVIPTHLQP